MLDRYRLNNTALNLIYRPYIKVLKEQLKMVQKLRPDFKKGKVATPEKKSFWQTIEHKIKGKFHVIR